MRKRILVTEKLIGEWVYFEENGNRYYMRLVRIDGDKAITTVDGEEEYEYDINELMY